MGRIDRDERMTLEVDVLDERVRLVLPNILQQILGNETYLDVTDIVTSFKTSFFAQFEAQSFTENIFQLSK